MINAIDIALRHIHAEIPPAILKTTFVNMSSVDQEIKHAVIYKYVIPDCNLKGGKVTDIELKADWAVSVGNSNYGLFKIPPEAREYKNIIEVHEVTVKHYNLATGLPTAMFSPPIQHPLGPLDHAPAMIYATNNMLNSKTGFANIPQRPIAESLEGNMVQLHPTPVTFTPWVLVCRIAYDNEMTNLNTGAISAFADLCVKAVKRYCYTQLIVGIDSGQILFGSELPSIRNILSGWENIQTEYRESIDSFIQGTFTDMRRFEGVIRGML